MKKGLLIIVALLVVSLAGCVAAPIDNTDKQAAPKENISETNEITQLTQIEQTEETVANKEEIKTDKKEEVKPEAPTETVAPTEPAPTEQTPQRIGKEKAKAAALKHANVKEADVRDLEIELDKEKGVKHYEITFESAGYDYEYIIDGQSGEILHQEKERD